MKRPKIVFYIRAIFKESISPKIENYDARIVVKNFNKFSKITVEEYREKIHEIQKSCLNEISKKIIYNSFDGNTNSGWPYTYDVLQNSTIEKLKSLDDDSILIPLDDDDWLSPKITEVKFCKNGLTIWNTISIPDTNSSNIFYHIKNIALPKDVRDEKDIIKLNSLLSNCAAISGNVVKKMIDMKQTKMLERLLQRHIEPRKVIREPIFSDLNLGEVILEDYLAVYVKHACNISFIKILGGDKVNQSTYDKLVEVYKNMDYSKIFSTLSPNYVWCKKYLNSLQELNTRL